MRISDWSSDVCSSDLVAQGLCLPYAQAGAMAVAPEHAGTAAGAVVFSQMFFAAACQQLTGMLADGTWVPLGAVYTASFLRSEERSGGKEGISTLRSRWLANT